MKEHSWSGGVAERDREKGAIKMEEDWREKDEDRFELEL